jgi:ubiquitin C-terminal hydrolase
VEEKRRATRAAKAAAQAARAARAARAAQAAQGAKASKKKTKTRPRMKWTGAKKSKTVAAPAPPLAPPPASELKRGRRKATAVATPNHRGAAVMSPPSLPMPPPTSFRPRTFLSLNNFPICPHISTINAINFDKVQRVITRPARWRCKECSHCNDAWVCLSCAHVGCGRFLGKHAYNHHAQSKPNVCDIAMSITNGFCFCYRCNEYVISADDHGYDHRKGDHSELRLLQGMLADCKNQQFGESRTRRGSLIRKAEDVWERNSKRGRLGLVTPADQKRQLQQDRIDTIVVHRRLLRLQQAFRGWSGLRQHRRRVDSNGQSPPREIMASPTSGLGRLQALAASYSSASLASSSSSSGSSSSSSGSSSPSLIRAAAAENGRLNQSETSAFSTSANNAASASSSGALSISPERAFHLMRAVVTPSPRSYLAFENAHVEEARRTGAMSASALMAEYRSRQSLIRPGRAGLNNLGNTCYINSVFQCLSHTLPFWKYFIRFRHDAVRVLRTEGSATAAASAASAAAAAIAVPSSNSSSSSSSPSVSDIPGPPPRLLQRQTSNECYDNATLRRSEVSSFLKSSGRRNKKKQVSKKRKRSNSEGVGDDEDDDDSDDEDKGVSLSSEVHNVLRVLWSGKWAVATPYSLVFAIWRFVPQFRSYLQQDAQEFYNSFIDAVHIELLDVAKQAEAMLGSGNSAMRNASTAELTAELTRVSENARTFVDTIFQGSGCNEIRCLHCGHTSQREENFLSLSVMIPSEFQGKSKVVSSLKKVRSSVAKIKREAKLKAKKEKQEAAKAAREAKAAVVSGETNPLPIRPAMPQVPNFSASSSSCASKNKDPVSHNKPAKDPFSFGSASVRAARPRVMSSADISDSDTESSSNSTHLYSAGRRRLLSTSCTVQECLNAHTAKEYLTGDSQYFCEKCDCKRDATKRVVGVRGYLALFFFFLHFFSVFFLVFDEPHLTLLFFFTLFNCFF